MSLRTGRPGQAHAVLGALGGVAVVFFALPLVALVGRVTPAGLWAQLGSPGVQQALRLSLEVSLISLGLCVVFGFPLAFVLARVAFPGRALVRGLVSLPMVLPPVVGGIALLAAFGRRGLLGGALEQVGVVLPFTTAGAVLAVTFVAMPFLVTTLEAALATVDPRLEQAAATLGASRWRVLWTVTLPAVRPSLTAGLALCWARGLGEFGATITFAGNLEGRTQTMPLAVYDALQSDPEAAITLGLVLLAVSLTLLTALRGHIGRRR
jgi:molybdate transport system permease protein